uniref:Leucine rich repeat containing 74A n=1 Tax=Pygocentrus nattereri TaxID=42514 RepID=A0AAR2LRI7_PYGNA
MNCVARPALNLSWDQHQHTPRHGAHHSGKEKNIILCGNSFLRPNSVHRPHLTTCLEDFRMDQSTLSLDSLSLAERGSPFEAELGDEWDTDMETEELKSSRKDMSTAELYLQACKLVGVVPVSYFLRNLGCTTINLNHHGLGPLGGKAMAIALVTDMHTTTLELADNSLLAEGARCIVEMLRANFTIQNLDLSNNHLQSAGAECVAKMLLDNVSIKSIKLSGTFIVYVANFFFEVSKIDPLFVSRKWIC